MLQSTLRRVVLSVTIAITASFTWSQTTIFSENMGSPSGTVTIAANTFQNAGLAFSGSADVRNTTPSTGYTGASGNGNVFITNTVAKDFIIGNINTVGYSAMVLTFGHYKSTTASNNELVVEVSTDGVTYTPLTYSRPTGAGTASWTLITASGTIPATANLRIRFRQTSATPQFRVDDVKLVGTIACTPGAAPTTAASAFSATTFCTSAQINFTAGNGTKRIAVVSTTNFSNTPTNGTAYAANAAYGSGALVGAGNYVVLNGTANTVTVTGLVSGTTYYIKVFEYNGVTANCDESYQTAGITAFSFTTQSNCATPQIRSVLVDACSNNEGVDELVIIENGANPLSVSSMSIAFPSGGTYCNSGCSTNTLLNNPTYISQLNAQAGCTLFQYADPIPAGGIVVVFTGLTPSYTFDYSPQCPSATTYYAVFCNNSSIAGRFANSGTGTRTLDIDFTTSTDQVTYDLSSTLGDGTYVDFDAPGNATYRQVANCIYPLGVEWGYFAATKVDEGVQVAWETLSEVNTDYFAVEHADQTGNFVQIGKVNCAGKSTSAINYGFLDRHPANGLNYYRLKQLDLDGAATYSAIAALNYASNDFAVYYLPEVQQLSFSQPLKEGSRVEIYQSNGQLMQAIAITSQQTSIPVTVSPGIWLVRIQEADGQIHFSKVMVF